MTGQDKEKGESSRISRCLLATPKDCPFLRRLLYARAAIPTLILVAAGYYG
ncbi:MAG: hypothetical protein HYY30_13200 [Chloroflexi bacterium]|nr:hypothetical protein [Chloroflexota bacterium]